MQYVDYSLLSVTPYFYFLLTFSHTSDHPLIRHTQLASLINKGNSCLWLCHHFLPTLLDSFTVTLSNKSVMKLSLKIILNMSLHYLVKYLVHFWLRRSRVAPIFMPPCRIKFNAFTVKSVIFYCFYRFLGDVSARVWIYVADECISMLVRSSRVSFSPTRRSVRTSRWTCMDCRPTRYARSLEHAPFRTMDWIPSTMKSRLSSGRFVLILVLLLAYFIAVRLLTF